MDFPISFFQILTALKRIIAKDKLFDPNNPTVILCDDALDDALDVKALHVTEIRYVHFYHMYEKWLFTSEVKQTL